MTEQWRELKETITEMRDNGGTGAQQDVCKFLANLMETLEKQMQQPSEGAVSRADVKEQMLKYGFKAPDMTVTEFVEDCLPSVTPQRPKGKWIVFRCGDTDTFKCSECGMRVINPYKYCPNCGAEMEGEE